MKNQALVLLLCLLLLATAANKCRKEKPTKPPALEAPDSFFGPVWVYSFEDNKDTLQAYRPSDYNFPRSWFRHRFVFTPDSISYTYPGPTDIPETDKGSWKAISNNKLEATFKSGRVYEITVYSFADDIIYLTKKETQPAQ